MPTATETSSINIDKMVQDCMNAINTRVRNLKKLNIITVGKVGVGKSTLINSIFKGNFAKTGIGRPVTDTIKEITKENYPLAIYDTPGFEMSAEQQEELKKEILDIINKGYNSNDINNAINCIWYCISGSRYEDAEIKWLKEFSEENKLTRVPIIVVITQAIPKKEAQELKTLIEKENLNVINIVPVLAQDKYFDDEYTAKSYGLDDLIDIMVEALPAELQETLQNVQIASLEAKKKAAQAAVAVAVTAAVAEGAAPIPFSDAALLIPTQVTMIAAITSTFGIEVNKGFLTVFISSTIGTAGTTVLGKTIVSSLLKFIPGVGTAVGSTISGTTAGILTAALGAAYIKIMEKVYLGELDSDSVFSAEGQEEINRMFKEELKKGKG